MVRMRLALRQPRGRRQGAPAETAPRRTRARLHRICTLPVRLLRTGSLVLGPMCPPGPVSPTRTILVVEDEPPIAEAVATRLRSEGFEVTLAFDGPTGVTRCEELRPDL